MDYDHSYAGPNETAPIAAHVAQRFAAVHADACRRLAPPLATAAAAPSSSPSSAPRPADDACADGKTAYPLRLHVTAAPIDADELAASILSAAFSHARFVQASRVLRRAGESERSASTEVVGLAERA